MAGGRLWADVFDPAAKAGAERVTFFKVANGFTDHPKIEDAGPEAGWLFICGLDYCTKHLTDGHIPKSKVARLSAFRNNDRLAERLVTVGLWLDLGDEYEVCHYLRWQTSSAKVRDEREKAKKRRRSREQSPDVPPTFEESSPDVQPNVDDQNLEVRSDLHLSSSSNLVEMRPDDDELLRRTWRLLAERTASTEAAAGRGPKSPNWYPAVERSKARDHAERVSGLDLAKFDSAAQLADYLEPAEVVKPSPLDATAAATQARMDRHDNPCEICRGNGLTDDDEFCTACHPLGANT